MGDMINKVLFGLNFAFAVLGLVQVINGDHTGITLFALFLNSLAAYMLYKRINQPKEETPVNGQ